MQRMLFPIYTTCTLLAATARSSSAFAFRFTTKSTSITTRRSSSSLSMASAVTSTSTSASASTNNAATATRASKLSLSPRILETLDPCVVLMKELIEQYAPLWQDKGGIFSLAQGVVYWEPPSSCQERLIQELSSNDHNSNRNVLHTYGPADGIPELTSALQDKIATENGLTNHKVMVTVGANQAYMNCVLTCLNEDSKAVVFAPYYFNHVMALQMCCGDDSVVVGPCNDHGIPNVEWLKETLEESSKSQSSSSIIDMVTIVNPGNPTGVSLGKDQLQPIVDLCAQHNVWLVLDCTYEYFTTPEQNHQPIATFPDASHVIYIFSFSKSYALAGYRCGYVCVPNTNTNTNNNNNNNNKSSSNNNSSDGEEREKTNSNTNTNANSNSALWKNMLKVQDTIPIGPPRISQIAALGALQAGPTWVREQYATLDASRQLILNALSPLPKTMGGSGAMYVMAQLPPAPSTTTISDHNDSDSPNTNIMDDIEICRQLVQDYGIAIIPGSFCGFPGWIRVCYANLSPTQCQEAAERLEKGIQELF